MSIVAKEAIRAGSFCAEVIAWLLTLGHVGALEFDMVTMGACAIGCIKCLAFIAVCHIVRWFIEWTER